MKICKVDSSRFFGDQEKILIDKINELIDSVNKLNSEKGMSFEEALMHLKSGKSIKRKEWTGFEWEINEESDEEVSYDDLMASDWMVIDD